MKDTCLFSAVNNILAKTASLSALDFFFIGMVFDAAGSGMCQYGAIENEDRSVWRRFHLGTAMFEEACYCQRNEKRRKCWL